MKGLENLQQQMFQDVTVDGKMCQAELFLLETDVTSVSASNADVTIYPGHVLRGSEGQQ